jgi:hypothetical protein
MQVEIKRLSRFSYQALLVVVAFEVSNGEQEFSFERATNQSLEK